jgi:hypothetical protein
MQLAIKENALSIPKTSGRNVNKLAKNGQSVCGSTTTVYQGLERSRTVNHEGMCGVELQLSKVGPGPSLDSHHFVGRNKFVMLVLSVWKKPPPESACLNFGVRFFVAFACFVVLCA